ncbi:copia protein [Trichonephila clavipes]|nr:copia protein [Trichonephila clavipes]
MYATLLHSISTDAKPQHSKCPAGENSWCFYQSAIANGEKPNNHKLNVGTPINEKFLTKILPIYQRLASNELLERCIRCGTQNANESLHSMIWAKCPKEIFVNKRRVKRAVTETVCEYNRVQQIYRWKEEDFRVVKIEAELILEANRLQLMKQDLEKAENAYLSSFTSKNSKTLPGATAAAHGNPNGKNDYQKKSGKFDKGVWVIDTAATSHFCNDKSLFLDLKQITNMKMSLATDDKSCPVEGIGTLRFRPDHYIIPKSKEISFFSDVTAKTKNGSIEIWHQRFCHVNNDYLVKTSKNDSVKGLPRLTDNGKTRCIPCKLAKSKRVSFKRRGP